MPRLSKLWPFVGSTLCSAVAHCFTHSEFYAQASGSRSWKVDRIGTGILLTGQAPLIHLKLDDHYASNQPAGWQAHTKRPSLIKEPQHQLDRERSTLQKLHSSRRCAPSSMCAVVGCLAAAAEACHPVRTLMLLAAFKDPTKTRLMGADTDDSDRMTCFKDDRLVTENALPWKWQAEGLPPRSSTCSTSAAHTM